MSSPDKEHCLLDRFHDAFWEAFLLLSALEFESCEHLLFRATPVSIQVVSDKPVIAIVLSVGQRTIKMLMSQSVATESKLGGSDQLEVWSSLA